MTGYLGETLWGIVAAAAIATTGWTIDKGYRVSKQVEINTNEITDLKDSVEHIRGRVDAIFDHLIAKNNRG